MKRRILVVDDDRLTREHLRVILELDQYEVETAGDGRSALEALHERVFHLVITDLRMPDMSGIELLDGRPLRTAPLRRDRADRVRRHPGGARRDEGRRRRLRHQALRPGSPPLHRPADPRAPPPDRRARAAPQADARRLQLPQHGVEEPEDAEDLRPDRAGRPARLDGDDLRRDRHRQGARRPGDPRRRQPPQGAVRRPELRRPARLAARERAVRPRAGRVHRRRPAEERAVRDGRRRHAASSTRSATSRRRCSRSCSASCRPAPSSGSAGPRRSRSTSGSSPRATSGWRTRSRRAGSARTCSTA